LYNGMIRTRKNKDETYGSRSTTLQYTVCGSEKQHKNPKASLHLLNQPALGMVRTKYACPILIFYS
ncbi:MAG: hypothetical protein ACK559_34180, partial [bacterium]